MQSAEPLHPEDDSSSRPAMPPPGLRTSRTSSPTSSDTHAKRRSTNHVTSSTRKRGGSSSTSKTRSISSHATTSDKTPAILQTSKSVLYGRLVFLVVLVTAAAGLGYAAYALMAAAQESQAASRFDSIAERALSVAQLVVQEKKKATDSLALMVGSANPQADAWPNVYLDGYTSIARSLGIVTEGSLSFCPIVQPGGAQQASFEAFAYDLFYNTSNYDNTTGVSAFGRGIFSFGKGPHGNATFPDGRFPSTTGWTYHRRDHKDILLPFLQSDHGAHPVLMLNVYFEHNRAAAIDNVMACSDERAQTQDYERECGSITDLMWSETKAEVDPGPAGMMMVPIYPRKDPAKLTGFIVGKQIWHDLLKHGFESDVNGLHVVLRTPTRAHTYRIQDGMAVYAGEGDLHDTSAHLFSSVGTRINPRYFSNNTVPYYMDIYATQDYMLAYQTNNPKTACIGAVLIMALTALLFLGYDYFVRREFHDKKKLLEAKRQFVRYVSHEVRTPLNTVCLGLTLLQHDFASVLGLRRGSQSSTTTTKMVGDKIDKERVEEWMQLSTQVFQNADAAVGVLSDLLNYDKIQMGTLTLELSLIPIWHSLERTVHEFKIAALEKRVHLTIDFSRLNGKDDDDVEACCSSGVPSDLGFCKVVGDNVKLTQVFRNLISNGLKFSREGGNLIVRVFEKQLPEHKRRDEIVALAKEERVTLILRGDVVIQVIDDGVGMTKEQTKTVFDDGTQFNANKFQAGGGSGLGMNISQGVVSQHDGKLSAHSGGLGMGSIFTVTLPLYETNEDEKSTHDPTDATPLKDGSGGKEEDSEFSIPKLNILVVDDAVSNRKLCIRLLQRSGHTCEGACDGKEAVEMVKKAMESGKPYDCILLDYEMPNMNGPEACEKMRKMGCSSYIAGVTGNVMSEDVDHFRNCGANCVLPKPFRLETLEEQLVEDGVTPFEQDEMVRVESGGNLVEMGDDVALSLSSLASLERNSGQPFFDV
ncbi:sensor kinase/phosphatase LuxQ [Seminavis robusta]|uniref:histidine kinase n=1 Tax=Seminavis robusta TaxID=568900 RepID=A0A9N8DGR5_9STRA|nr:sensor kinase/phosphatase LuxQ [Seminavis robusta]|eukprot:Sro112_g055500.1 sensor kinase/phosphatase LuxQ (983) ;mRNA; f:15636-18930